MTCDSCTSCHSGWCIQYAIWMGGEPVPEACNLFEAKDEETVDAGD